MTQAQMPLHSLWPYLPTLLRLGLALILGVFVGLERERRGKDAGVRTLSSWGFWQASSRLPCCLICCAHAVCL